MLSGDDVNPNESEYRNRRIVDAARPRSMAEEEQRRKDILAVAATPAGKRLLAWMVGKELSAVRSFSGNSRDAYSLGRYHTSEELRATLESVLPRETYIEIVFPLPASKKEAT